MRSLAGDWSLEPLHRLRVYDRCIGLLWDSQSKSVCSFFCVALLLPSSGSMPEKTCEARFNVWHPSVPGQGVVATMRLQKQGRRCLVCPCRLRCRKERRPFVVRDGARTVATLFTPIVACHMATTCFTYALCPLKMAPVCMAKRSFQSVNLTIMDIRSRLQHAGQ